VPNQDRDRQFQELYDKARAAGLAAGERHRPVPFVAIQRENPFDDSSPIVKQYEPEMDGACGFGWIIVKPGNSPFANWLKRNDLARKDHYYGGVNVWVRDFGQSYEKKYAYARAFAGVLESAGIRAVGMGRMD
jgi:hypothetical protein